MYSFSTFFLFFVYLAAYKHADGKKIDGRRVLVDVERGRTVKGWRPRRLGKSSFDQTCFLTGLNCFICFWQDGSLYIK